MSVVAITSPFDSGIRPWISRGNDVLVVDVQAQDAEILAEMQAGDDAALGTLYDRYGSLAFTMAYRMLSDRHLAEDVVQDVFLSIWRNVASYDSRRSSFRSWFLTIVRNRCFDKLRSKATQPQLSPEVEIADQPGGQDVVREVTQSLRAERVREALGTLPPEQRQTIELAYYGGLSQTEISERMAVPLGTVKGRVRMAMQKLRDMLSGLEFEGQA
ncbi:MAG TPA: sigma-70 family RNA polymerase sigma factor [Chloroflexota bacterium]|jgi:RNA polymerase sigma-70 factor (ECF subfamily)|nr:sigma-70 family RNA polymerase sigma factor [Chloroflexota bacterium]